MATPGRHISTVLATEGSNIFLQISPWKITPMQNHSREPLKGPEEATVFDAKKLYINNLVAQSL